jgi:hypothetical protein
MSSVTGYSDNNTCHIFHNEVLHLGICSQRALRLVDYCLGDFKDKPAVPCKKAGIKDHCGHL